MYKEAAVWHLGLNSVQDLGVWSEKCYTHNWNLRALTSLPLSYCLLLHTFLCDYEAPVGLGFGFFSGCAWRSSLLRAAMYLAPASMWGPGLCPKTHCFGNASLQQPTAQHPLWSCAFIWKYQLLWLCQLQWFVSFLSGLSASKPGWPACPVLVMQCFCKEVVTGSSAQAWPFLCVRAFRGAKAQPSYQPGPSSPHSTCTQFQRVTKSQS